MPSTALRPVATAAKVTCATCELHAEAVFRVDGMDCHEEVVILERRLKPLTGVEAMTADVIGCSARSAGSPSVWSMKEA